jgi:hypothetical protein
LSEEAADAVCRRQLPIGAPWPETAVGGDPCDGGDQRAYVTENTRVCAVCADERVP